MKKTLLALAVLTVAGSAFALDVGVVGGYDWTAPAGGFAGVTVGQKFDKLGVTGGFERTTVGENQNRWNVIGSYDFASYDIVTFVVKGGAVYIDPSYSPGGWAGQAGVGVSIPVMDKVSATVDYRYQFGQSRFEGSQVLVGAKYSF